MTLSPRDNKNSKLIGPNFMALQVRDLEASKAFYVERMGLTPVPQSPPGAVVFKTEPVRFGIRKPLVDLDATSLLGWGVSLWIAATDADVLHAQLSEAAVPIVLPLANGSFGRFFAFRDPDGYAVTASTAQPRIARTTLDPKGGYLTFINTFTVEPDNTERLLQALRDATEEIFRHQPGISANPHVSHDLRRVVNYAQWRSKRGLRCDEQAA
jgi:catechol 2,3-dioxygenase-like lactoylglutathione lyase family enzyme